MRQGRELGRDPSDGTTTRRLLSGLMQGCAFVGMAAFASAGAAQTAPAAASPNVEGGGVTPTIGTIGGVSSLLPAPQGTLDTQDITGVGDMLSAGCSGVLINPRTVLTANHCTPDLNQLAAFPTGWSFTADSSENAERWLGNRGVPAFRSDPAHNLYRVEDTWHPAASSSINGFVGDVALQVLDRPVFNVPTWKLLLTPLTGQTHAELIGYGVYGDGAVYDDSLYDSRRRIAENMISALGVLRSAQSWYLYDFDDAARGTASASPQDRDLFPGDALPHEAIARPGDSGGPVIADRIWSDPLVVGVTSNNLSIFPNQQLFTYGTVSRATPLFLFWEELVANNPYVYAATKSGDANWFDPSHWVQLMDPAYISAFGDSYVNALPTTHQAGVSSSTPLFGNICFSPTNCVPINGAGPAPGEQPETILVPGGPGSTNFVPNNVTANPISGIHSRYYDVTLAGSGTTVLGGPGAPFRVRIDRLSLADSSGLAVRPGASLTVLGDLLQAGAGSRLSIGESPTPIDGAAVVRVSGNFAKLGGDLSVARARGADGLLRSSLLDVSGFFVQSAGSTTIGGAMNSSGLAVGGGSDFTVLEGGGFSTAGAWLQDGGHAVVDGYALVGAFASHDAGLSIGSLGTIIVAGDYGQIGGTASVDGVLEINGALGAVINGGFLTGSGSFFPTHLTVNSGVIAPGGADVFGRLDIYGDVTLNSDSALFIDAGRGQSDFLRIFPRYNPDLEALGNLTLGGALVFNKPDGSPAPRHGDRFTIIQTFQGTIANHFDSIFSFQGVLRPVLTYRARSVSVEFKAGSFVEILDGGNAREIALANALDALRTNSYGRLYDLYGAIDLMDGGALRNAFDRLVPGGLNEAIGDVRRNQRVMDFAWSRLSTLGTSAGGTFTLVGAPAGALGGRVLGDPWGLGRRDVSSLPRGMSFFMLSGTGRSLPSSAGQTSIESREFGAGAELALGRRATIGLAASRTESTRGSRADGSAATYTHQSIAYGSYRLGRFYAGALAAATRSRIGATRLIDIPQNLALLSGSGKLRQIRLVAESGFDLGSGPLVVTPRLSLGYSAAHLSKYAETGGESALALDSTSDVEFEGRAGAQLRGRLSLGGGWVLMPDVAVDRVARLGGHSRFAARFAAAPEQAFRFSFDDEKASWTRIDGRIDLLRGSTRLGLAGHSDLGRSGYGRTVMLAELGLAF